MKIYDKPQQILVKKLSSSIELSTKATTKLPLNATKTHHHLSSSLEICLIFFSLLIIANSTHADWLMECGNCRCKWNSGKKTADCKNLSLIEVPEKLSPHVQVLDLSYNRIPYLQPNAFLNAQLHNLHKLYIRNATLQQIDKRSFTQLEILIELDLSHNLLNHLQVNQFAHLVKVRALILNYNLIETLGNGVFQHLKFLHRLELKNNRLTHISTEVFVNLPMLSQIYLDENQLSFLRKATFDHLKRLTALALDQNPWNCTCELENFRNFVFQRNLYTPPTACYYPSHLRGMLWIENQPDAFACKPKIVHPAKGTSITLTNENVTLICRVYASSNTHIFWHHNKQLVRPKTVVGGNQRLQIQLLREENSKDGNEGGRHLFISRLTIIGANRRDEGIYTCLAENAGGQDSVQMSLYVENTTTNNFWFPQGNLLIVIGLMALSLLSIIFFVTMVFCCIYKRFKHSNSLAQHDHQNHEQHHRPQQHHHQHQQQQQQQPHLDIQLTMSGNVVVDSTSINAASMESSSNDSGKTTSTSPLGSHYHLVRENINANSNKTTKKFTTCLLQKDIVSNENYHTRNLNKENGSPLRLQKKDPSAFLSLSDIAAQNSNRFKSKVISNNRAVQKEIIAVGDFKPDLLSAYNSGRVNS